MKKSDAKASMEIDWDVRARHDAVEYVASKYRGDEFFKDGTEQAYKFCSGFFQKEGFKPAGGSMLDIGCGIGRMERGFSQMFGEVWGLDVSGEMVARAKELNREFTNVKFVKGSGSDLAAFPDNSLDFVFSYITFQHIPDKKLIFDYFSEIHRVLKPGGLFKVLLRKPLSGIALAFGFIPVPRCIFTYIPGVIWKTYENMARNETERLRRGSTYRGCGVSEKEASRALNLKFSKVEFEEDPARVVYWCRGKK